MGLLGDFVATAISKVVVDNVFCKTNAFWQCEYCGTQEGTPSVAKNPDCYGSVTKCPSWNYQRCHKWIYIGTREV